MASTHKPSKAQGTKIKSNDDRSAKRVKIFNEIHRPFNDKGSDQGMEDTSDEEYFQSILSSTNVYKTSTDNHRRQDKILQSNDSSFSHSKTQERSLSDECDASDDDADSYDDENDFFGFDTETEDTDCEGLETFLDTWKKELTNPETKQGNKTIRDTDNEFGNDRMQQEAIKKCKEKSKGLYVQCKGMMLDVKKIAMWA